MVGQLSTILNSWSEGVLSEFGINVFRDVLTSCSDSGSDVKRTVQVIIGAWWEWCIAHLSHLCLTDAFGTSIDPVKSKNKVARDLFKLIKKVIESVNKSDILQKAFEEQMLGHVEVYLKLINAPQHRWSSTALVLERILICWDNLIQAYQSLQRDVPLTDNHLLLCIEFYSIIEPVRAVQVKAQAMKQFVIIDVYVNLLMLYITVLATDKPLTLLEPARREFGSPPPEVRTRLAILLQPATHQARSILLNALSSRFFNRHHPILALKKPENVYGTNCGQEYLLKDDLLPTDFRFSYLLDSQTILYPAMTSGRSWRSLSTQRLSKILTSPSAGQQKRCAQLTLSS